MTQNHRTAAGRHVAAFAAAAVCIGALVVSSVLGEDRGASTARFVSAQANAPAKVAETQNGASVEKPAAMGPAALVARREITQPVLREAPKDAIHGHGMVHGHGMLHGHGFVHGEAHATDETVNGEVIDSGILLEGQFPFPPGYEMFDLSKQTDADAMAKSFGCIQCHQGVGDMHKKGTVHLGCVDCHGGDPTACDKVAAHVSPRFPGAWVTSANPVRSYTLLNHESPEFVRFVNPGDLRVAHLSCGTANCHPKETLQVRKSMMTHGAMLWGAALYNNGSVPHKAARYGESYSMQGAPQRMQTVPLPTNDETVYENILPFLDPLPRYEMSQPGNILRIFERGGRFRPEIGIPERLEESGRPRARLSLRGLGTENRTDPVFVGLTKTRLLDPTLNFLGTNDHPGDYRSSGCTACHVIYANDRASVHSGPYAKYGNLGHSYNPDPMIPKGESGHPIDHKFTVGIPTSQCMVCHMHPGTNVLNSYLGFMWWDQETDGHLMYPREQRYPTAEETMQGLMSNPEEGALRGLWSNPRFLENVSELNYSADHTQFADFHGHGWVYKAVFKKNRKGDFLDCDDQVIPEVHAGNLLEAMRPPSDEERVKGKCRSGVPVHYMDIHLEKGMHCVDCHFNQDVHGDTKLYGEVRAAIEITCEDCHGDATKKANLRTSGPAAMIGGRNLAAMRTPFGKPRFEWQADRLVQNSMVEEGLAWEVVQVLDTITPGARHYNQKSHLAKTVRVDEQNGLVWGEPNFDAGKCAHKNESMSCASCHSAWNPSCFGCHLSQKANKKAPLLHAEGDVTRNLTSYNFQTLRDDVYMLAKDGNATGNRINPARSSCAVHVSSYNQNRESIYVQQQTISADGMSGIAFSTNVPHTVRGRDGTKQCADCHVSAENDNNAIMAQLLMQGTNYTNFIGQYCWVGAGEHGLEGVVVTTREEPQAVIGSELHSLAYPDFYKEHVENGRELEHAHEHPGVDISEQFLKPFQKPEINSLQARGEYLYAACGCGGLRVFDIAFIDHKAFAERITTAPVSPLGQRFYVPTKFATAVAAPATLAPDPTRVQNPNNQEQAIHGIYGYIFVVDKYEGLITVGAGTLLDGDPLNNFLERETTFNPNGILCGAKSITIVGTYAYICCDAGLVVVSLEDPKKPCVTSVIGHPTLDKPVAAQVQFRYAFVCDHHGVHVFDVTNLACPQHVTHVEVEHAHNIYVARTYAYVAAGETGLVILDVENPEKPFVDQIYNANGCINDLHDVKLGITYATEYAYLADGKNGLRVVQLGSTNSVNNQGYSPRPTPRLIATRKLPKEGHAHCISEGLDRDRAVDECGNQIAVFGRIGARPLNLFEQQKMFMNPDGSVWKVSNDPLWHGYRYVGPRRSAGPALPRFNLK